MELYKNVKALMSERTFVKLSKVLFAVYCALLFWVVMLKCNQMDILEEIYIFMSGLSLKERFLYYIIPFSQLFDADNFTMSIIYEDLLNVFIFLPLGGYAALFSNKPGALRSTLTAFAVSLCAELLQLFFLIGGFSTADLITNTLGGFIGYYLFRVMYKQENMKALNVSTVCVMCFMIPSLVFATVNTVANIDVYLDIVLRR